jgi:hypothetical protein
LSAAGFCNEKVSRAGFWETTRGTILPYILLWWTNFDPCSMWLGGSAEQAARDFLEDYFACELKYLQASKSWEGGIVHALSCETNNAPPYPHFLRSWRCE